MTALFIFPSKPSLLLRLLSIVSYLLINFYLKTLPRYYSLAVASFMFSGGNWVNITLPNLFQFIPPRRVNNKILIFMETFSDSFHHFYVSVSLSFPS